MSNNRYLDRKSTLLLFVCRLTAALTQGIQLQTGSKLPGAAGQASKFMNQHSNQEITDYR